MPTPPKKPPTLHPRNCHQGRYDLQQLTQLNPKLAQFVVANQFGKESIDFSDAEAVRTLNQSLLLLHYGVQFWKIPEGYLCPPIPGRADYIHHLADLLAGSAKVNSRGSEIRCLDVGTGASAIYPIIGHLEYGWKFVGTDVDKQSLENAKRIFRENPKLEGACQFRFQPNPGKIFSGVFNKNERFSATLCNPPFHRSLEEAQKGNRRKLSNLQHRSVGKSSLNFGGQSVELWCEGGEKQFIATMIAESKHFASQCDWFTTLVSKKDHLKTLRFKLEKAKARQIRIIEMGQGNKVSRMLAWSFVK